MHIYEYTDMDIHRISVPVSVQIRKLLYVSVCGYPQNIYLRIHICTSLNITFLYVTTTSAEPSMIFPSLR